MRSKRATGTVSEWHRKATRCCVSLHRIRRLFIATVVFQVIALIGCPNPIVQATRPNAQNETGMHSVLIVVGPTAVDSARNLADDSAVKSLAVEVWNGSATGVGQGLLAKQPDGTWKGRITVSEAGLLSFHATAYAMDGGKGDELYSGDASATISEDGQAVTVPVILNLRKALTNGAWYDDSLTEGQANWYYYDANRDGQSCDIAWDCWGQGSGTKTLFAKVSAYKRNLTDSYFVDATSGYNTPENLSASKGRIYIKVSGYWSISAGTYAVKLTTDTAVKPTFYPAEGSFLTDFLASLHTTTEGASIRYTTDGSEPSRDYGTVYTGPIAISPPMTLKAIAYKTDWRSSEVAVAHYALSTVSLLDQSFGIRGIAKIPIGSTGSEDGAYAVALQSDGKIILAGISEDNIAVARLNIDGSSDTSFGTAGCVVLDLGPGAEQANGVAVQPDGRIIVGGFSGAISHSDGLAGDFALARLLSNGSIDGSFGNNGVVHTNVGTFGGPAYAMVLQPDGKILLGGTGGSDIYGNFILSRYNADGTLDASFGSGGEVETNIGARFDIIRSLAIQQDGKIVAVGTSTQIDAGAYTDTALVRYNTNGSLDTTFGSGGIVRYNYVSEYTEEIKAVVLQSDGKILIGGQAGRWSDPVLMRFSADGTLDASFGSGGVVLMTFTGTVFDMAALPDDRIVVVGNAASGSQDTYISRLLADGSFDPIFNSGQILQMDVSSSCQTDMARALVIQPDGKVVVAGYSDDGPEDYYDYSFMAVRF